MLNTYIAFLRAVNVGGANSLTMSDFTRLLGSMGFKDIKTYIQSGNAVFRAAEADPEKLAEQIAGKISRSHGLSVGVVVFKLSELASAVAANPYPDADSNPKALHLTFLASAPAAPALGPLEGIRNVTERFTLQGRVLYFYAPEGVGRSKLFARLEKALGVPATARNWRTACKILEIAQQVAAADVEPRSAASRAAVAGIVERLPEARAVAHGTHLSLEVGKRRFAWHLQDHHGDGRTALHCKATPELRQRLRREAKDLLHVPKYLGRHGWLGLWLDVAEVDWSLVEAALQEAYRLTAPKKLVAKLEAGS